MSSSAKTLLQTDPGLIGISTDGVNVTASDVTVYDPPLRYLWVGGGGNVVITGMDDVDVTWTGVQAGGYILMACTKVKAATTATNIVGCR